MSGAIGNVLVVDANVLMAALLGGRAADIVYCPRLTLFTTLRTTWEVQRYIPMLARKLARQGAKVGEAELEADFESMPVTPLPESFYRSRLRQARTLIERRDPKDVDLLALALLLSVPLWTNDRHFEGLEGVRTATTADLLTLTGL